MLLRTLFALIFTMSALPIFAQTPPVEPGVSHELAVWRWERYSNVRYRLNLTLEKMSPVLKGTIEIRVVVAPRGQAGGLRPDRSGPPASAGGTDAVILDWRKIKGSESLSTVADVSINGKAASHSSGPPAAYAGGSDLYYEEANEHLIFRDGVVAGENVIKLDFTSPILTSGSAITRYVDKEDGAEYIYSLFVPSDASTAFPVFDQPDLKARFALHLDLPNDWRAVSNSVLNETLKLDGLNGPLCENCYWSEETKPISTYVFAFAAGSFEKFAGDGSVPGAVATGSPDGHVGVSNSAGHPVATAPGTDKADPPMSVYVRKSQAAKFKQHAAEVFRLNREGIKFLEQYFDYKFPFPKYNLVLIPEFPFGGMEHAGATFLREDRVIFPQEPTKNDYITRANVIFHEAAHQWFGDTVTMKWFDDLWLKEGFAEFMAYKTLEKVMPEYNAWKIFYERNKQAAYLTDSTKGTTPIYQEIKNLSAAKSAYGNIVYRKAPSFLRQAEFYIGEDKFQTAVRAFLKKHEFANAGWEDLVTEIGELEVAEAKKTDGFQKLSIGDKKRLEDFQRWSVRDEWAQFWVQKPGTAVYRVSPMVYQDDDPNSQRTGGSHGAHTEINETFLQTGTLKDGNYNWLQNVKILEVFKDGSRREQTRKIGNRKYAALVDAERAFVERIKKKNAQLGRKFETEPWIPAEQEALAKSWDDYVEKRKRDSNILAVLPNYQDYGYGIFLLDDKSRDYVLKNIQNEKDDFLRTMMWGSLWDSVREAELDPKDYVELVIKNINVESDESTIQTLLARVSTAMNYYLSVPPAVAGGSTRTLDPHRSASQLQPPATAGGTDLSRRLEAVLIGKMLTAPTPGQRITFYRSFLNVASTENGRRVLKEMLHQSLGLTSDGGKQRNVKPPLPEAYRNYKGDSFGYPTLRTKDKFDIVTKLLILGDPDASALLTQLEKSESSDEAKRYAYAAKAGIATAENKAKFWTDFTTNKDISESWIESAFVPFNSTRHADLTLPYLEKALAELPKLKRDRKIFFVNGWLGAFIGGQKSEQALAIVNKFLADNPDLDNDLRLKILENVDLIERAVKIRSKFEPVARP